SGRCWTGGNWSSGNTPHFVSFQYPDVESLDLEARGRSSPPTGTLRARFLGRRRRRSAQLSLRRPHASHTDHAAILGLYKNRRRLRPSLQLLHHSAASRTVPLAAFR